MADLTDIQAAQSIKVVGSDAAGIETNPMRVDTAGGAQAAVYDTLGNPMTSASNGNAGNQLLHVQVPHTTTASTALGALNAAVSISMAGLPAVGFQLSAGTLVGTLTPELSVDDGTTWIPTLFFDPSSNATISSVVFTSSNTAKTYSIRTIGGTSNVRVRVSAYTSGTANAVLRATDFSDSSGSSGTQGEFVSVNNSSTTNLTAASTFTGLADGAVGYGSVGILFKTTQNATVQVQQSPDGTNWDWVDTYTVLANVGDRRTFALVGAFVRVLVTNNGGISTTTLRLQTILSPIPSTESTAPVATTAPSTANLVGGKNPTDGNIYPLQVDNQGRLVTSAITGFGADFSFGDITTSATTRVLVKRTAYTEQTTNGQRSIASASANDAAAGTGARTLMITYYDQTGAGPFTETMTLNGTARVNTVSTTICFIEQIEVLTAGSGGVNAGIITLFTVPTAGGSAIGTIAVGDNQTFWAHHYVATGKICNITGISCGHNGTTVGSGALFTINARTIGLANGVESQVSDFVRLYGQTSTFARNYASPIKVTGPARLQVYCTPETSSSTIYRAAFDFFEP